MLAPQNQGAGKLTGSIWFSNDENCNKGHHTTPPSTVPPTPPPTHPTTAPPTPPPTNPTPIGDCPCIDCCYSKARNEITSGWEKEQCLKNNDYGFKWCEVSTSRFLRH